ncbi:MAG: hypothetical protein ACK4TA_10880 [Saprospiraceae bacterium]
MTNFKKILKIFLKPENKNHLEDFINSKVSESNAKRIYSYLIEFQHVGSIPDISDISISKEGDLSVTVEAGRTFLK